MAIRSARRLAALLLCGLGFITAGEPAGAAGDWRIDVRVPMRDGVTLAADVLVPQPAARRPTILEFTPYGRGPQDINFRNEAEFWASHGYNFAIVDTRGQHDSGGEYAWFRKDADDGYDLLAWLAAQPWSDGRVGMRGASYTGANQWYVAKGTPPALKCIAPNASAGRPFGELPYMGGVFMSGWAIGWVALLGNSGVPKGTAQKVDWAKLLSHRPLLTLDEAALGRPLALYREMLSHPTLDAFWKEIELAPADFRRIAIPAFGSSGWFDGTLPGTVRYFEEMRRHSPAARDQFLVIGPWEHANVSDGGYDYLTNQPRRSLGVLSFPDAAFYDGKERVREFFDWCLKGGPHFDAPAARVWITGSDRWLDLPDYPAPDTLATAVYLTSDGRANGLHGTGRLVFGALPRARADRYVHDPMQPVSSIPPGGSGAPQGLMGNPSDLAPLIDRPDVLVYLSDALERPLTVLGSVRLALRAASDARDADFFFWLEDVGPDGKAHSLGSTGMGMARARYRDGYERERPLTPNAPFDLTIELYDVGHTFLAGHRLRVSIASSAYPFAFPNPGTGNPIATDTAQPRKARQTVYTGGAHATRLVLPVIATP